MESKELRVLRRESDRTYHVWLKTRDPGMRVRAQRDFMVSDARLQLALAIQNKDIRRIAVCEIHLITMLGSSA